MSAAAGPSSSSSVSMSELETESQQGSSSNSNGNANSVSQVECIVPVCCVCLQCSLSAMPCMCFHFIHYLATVYLPQLIYIFSVNKSVTRQFIAGGSLFYCPLFSVRFLCRKQPKLKLPKWTLHQPHLLRITSQQLFHFSLITHRPMIKVCFWCFSAIIKRIIIVPEYKYNAGYYCSKK